MDNYRRSRTLQRWEAVLRLRHKGKGKGTGKGKDSDSGGSTSTSACTSTSSFPPSIYNDLNKVIIALRQKGEGKG